MWDGGSTLSFITTRKANQLKLKGRRINLSMTTVGGQTTKLESYEYSVMMHDLDDNRVEVRAIGIDKISSSINRVSKQDISKVFQIDESTINRPAEGEVDMLVGLQYAAFHPVPIQTEGHLILYHNRFGKTIGGTHPGICENTKLDESCSQVRHAVTMHVIQATDTFFEIESLGVNCIPRCGACSCGSCHPGGKAMSLKDEEELRMIEERISFNTQTGRWLAEYPWIKKPSELSCNRGVAVAKLCSTERRLLKNPDYRSVYTDQIKDMLDRKVARKVIRAELEDYAGPTFYLAHHAVLKPESKSTPCRIVFDSKAQYRGLSLNDCLAKGPSLLNGLLGVLLRFREHLFAFIGDISKMYHSIDIPLKDQMMHLFLWRDCVASNPLETFAITAVNMGDRPSATIAQIALRKTAERVGVKFPESVGIIVNNAYMDDISASVRTKEEARARMEEISNILNAGNFKIKEWIHNLPSDEASMSRELPVGVDDEAVTEGVLGLRWDPVDDVLRYKFKSSVELTGASTKRSVLSTANSIYDPVGLLTPFTSKPKIIMRSIWAHEPRLGWDTPLPAMIEKQWIEVVEQIPLLTELSFRRALTPCGAVGKPALIIFSDGSVNAYGAVAYARWKRENGSYESRLIMAKGRIAPLKTVDIVRIELCGAVLSARLRVTIEKELEMRFERVVHLTDSEIVHAMIHRQSYGYNTFAANRVGEIHQSTKAEEWAWVAGKSNIADIITRGCLPRDLDAGTEWQVGPSFLSEEYSMWPVKFQVNKELPVPELKSSTIQSTVAETGACMKLVGNVEIGDDLEASPWIDAERYSNWMFLKRVTARVMKYAKVWMFRTKNKNEATSSDIDSSDVQAAETFWVKQAQRNIDLKRFAKFKPVAESGMIMVGGRTERWMACTWNRQRFVLLPKDSYISRLIARYEHERGGHLGVAASVSKVRSKYWVIGIRRMMKDVIQQCRHCREKLKAVQAQVMSPLPVERIKPSPAFTTVGVDYFGPFATKGEVQKRVRGKSYGVIFTCFSSRAVYVDVAHDLSTDGFLQTLRRFASLRGWPSKLYSDNGTQLVGASNEMKEIVCSLSRDEIRKFGQPFGTEWEFAPPDGKWYNGATEALVKSVKRALSAAIGENVMKFSELQTCMFEAAELVNERPIGAHPDSPEEGVYLCPNDLLLGRASNHVPQGPFKERTSNKHQFDFLQKVVAAFWKRWTRDVFPNMVIEPKWHTEQRDVRKGDVVLVQDLNPVRGRWKMALVEKSISSQDGRVRRVEISYRSFEGSRITVERPVQKLIVIVPNES